MTTKATSRNWRGTTVGYLGGLLSWESDQWSSLYLNEIWRGDYCPICTPPISKGKKRQPSVREKSDIGCELFEIKPTIRYWIKSHSKSQISNHQSQTQQIKNSPNHSPGGDNGHQSNARSTRATARFRLQQHLKFKNKKTKNKYITW
jgi:hypothetical protein